MKKIKAGMKVKVIYLTPVQVHFNIGHLGEEGIACSVNQNGEFFIKFLNGEEAGWWDRDNVEILDNK